ncbi:MAG TPA: ScyD/ScyE family protein [Thermomicrobiales bacterium]
MGRCRIVIGVIAALLLAAPFVAVSPRTTRAQDSAASVIASGLMNPRGFTWGSDGTLFVAEAGKGGTTPGDPQTPPPLGPITGGKTARVSWIADGCPANLADGLPSYITANGQTGGAADVAILNKKLYVLIAAGGASHGNPDQPAGVYAVGGDESVTLVADLGKWLRDNPVAKVPTDYSPDGSFFDMKAAPDGSGLLVVEANSQQLLKVTADGTVSRVADLSGDNQVPTSVAVASDGTIYVGYLSGAPFPNGAAKVVQIGDGTATTVWTGLTTVTGLAVAADGTLLALEMSTGNTETAPFFVEHSGKIVRQTGPDSAADVVTDLNLPTHLNLGPDGAYYVATPAIGADAGTGFIVRIAPSGTDPVSAADAVPAPGACGVATPVASPTAESGGATATASDQVAVAIYDFGFDPPTLTIKAGTTVTWTNTGEVEHTSVSFDKGEKTWDSDIMEPGDTYSYTFDKPGTFDYECGLHPNMKAVIKVTE